MYKLERDKFLTVLMLTRRDCDICETKFPKICGCMQRDNSTDFSTWEGYGQLVKWLKTQPLWNKIKWNMPMTEFMELATDPDKAADAAYKYLKEEVVQSGLAGFKYDW